MAGRGDPGGEFSAIGRHGLIGAGVTGPAGIWLLAEAVLGLLVWAAFASVLVRGWNAVIPEFWGAGTPPAAEGKKGPSDSP